MVAFSIPASSGGAVDADAERRLGGCEASDGNAIRAAADVVEVHLLAEGDAGRVATMLAANAHLQRGLRGPALIGGDTHHGADPFDVDADERVFGQHPLVHVIRQEAPGIVARQTEDGLRQVIGAEAEEVGDLRDLVRDQRGTRQLDHRVGMGMPVRQPNPA